MNTEKLTQKTIEALRGAQNAATENGNPSVEEEHLLYALLTQPDGLVGEVMRSVGASPEDMIAELDRLIAQFPKAGGSGYLFRAATVQDFSAVTGACLLVRTSVWDEVKGLDEKFAVAFNDVDFCLRVRDKGYRIVWTPYAQLTHYESKSRGGDEKDPVKAARFAAEQQRLYDIHGKADILDDPYYNPSLTRDREDFSESGDLRNLKEGKVTVRWRNA